MSGHHIYKLLDSSVYLLEQTVEHQQKWIVDLLDQVTFLEAHQSPWIALPETSPEALLQVSISQSIHTHIGTTCLFSGPSCITNTLLEGLASTASTANLLQGLGSSPRPEYLDIPGILQHTNKLIPRPLPLPYQPKKRTVPEHFPTYTTSRPMCLYRYLLRPILPD